MEALTLGRESERVAVRLDLSFGSRRGFCGLLRLRHEGQDVATGRAAASDVDEVKEGLACPSWEQE